MRKLWQLLLFRLVHVQAIELQLDDAASVKKACHDVAQVMLEHYTGNQPGDVPGNLPDPYYWWEAGAMFNALIDYWFYTGDDQWNDITTQGLVWQAGDSGTFMPANQTRTEGNDDQGFWAFAAMSAAERNFPAPPGTGPDWLAMAQATFNTQAWRWDTSSCNGGLKWQIFTWNAGYTYKNTISNGCFFNLAARLARYTGNQTYADWAIKVWDWTREVGFMTEEYFFYDGADETKNCMELDHIQWTYNAGVYLMGAAAMYNFTNGDPVWRERTEGIIKGTDVFFADEPKDVMFERACEPVDTCEIDQRSFKGYLARWMAASTQMAPFTYDLVMPKLRASASAAAKACTGGPRDGICGLKWTEQRYAGGLNDVGQQMSALEVIQSTLIEKVDPPVSQGHGGTSKGNPAAGAETPPPPPRGIFTRSITAGDQWGAAILTIVFSLGIVATLGFSMGSVSPLYDIPTHCKAGVIENAGPEFRVKVELVPVPEPGPSDILIKLNVTGLCQSDVHYMLDDLGISMSTFGVRSPGHEGAGVVVKMGENVRNWKLGDRAGIKPMMDTCGTCAHCWSDKETYCAGVVHTGLMTPGDWAVFPGGGGGVGIQGVQLAHAMGMRPLVVDTGDDKRALALKMGAEAFFDFKKEADTAAAVIKIADGIGAHGVFVTAQAAYPTALAYLGQRVGGAVMCIGIAPGGTMTIPVDPNLLLFKNTRIQGTLVGSRHDTAKALDFARRGKLQQICEVYPIDRLPEAVDKLRRGQVAGRIVVNFNQ
ncbi:glycosyl hydrolase family 76-domain-containing protein [Aspergillus pseudoustus]|uniref:mannan endo-1,6-alpha-mannosidase n=1 Tax=Aspergillus pseudoustus TaxID=1810923 RepID=A0ABR4JPC9_9EURO